jgi:ubiquinone/menaquinone biosynthesis C-methylase UbiE
MTDAYGFDQAWKDERARLAGLEAALDQGTRGHLIRLGARSGARCLEVGAGAGTVAFWLAEQVAPGGAVVATDIDTRFLEFQASSRPGVEILKHDLTAEELPDGFDLVSARWFVHWMPNKPQALSRLVNSLRPGGALLVEEPDFVTVFNTAQPLALRRVARAAVEYLEATYPVEGEYGRRLVDDLGNLALRDVQAEGRSLVVHGGSVPTDFLRLTLEKCRAILLAQRKTTEAEFAEATEALRDPRRSIMMPMTVAAWGWRT